LIRVVVSAVLSLLIAGSAFAQEGGLVVQNPLDEIRVALTGTLADSGVPFTDEQVQAIALAMDEQRRASEELFGQVLDFSGGPPQGAQLDQALAGIAWMSEAFLANIDDVLTPEQSEAWMRARMGGTVPLSARLDGDSGAGGGGAGSSDQIAQIRINNNPYTTESLDNGGGFRRNGGRGGRGGGGGNEVITRGGVGDFHGNANFTFQNDDLNSRNAFAENKPPYLRRNIDAGFNGPIIANRLTVGFTANQNHEDNVDTISAITPGGIVSEGITRPNLTRRFSGNGQLQLSDRQAVHFRSSYNLTRRDNQNIGGITLLERGRDSEFNFAAYNARSLTQLSNRTILDVAVDYHRIINNNRRVTQGVAIDVTDAFEGGGATEQNEGASRTVSLKSLLLRTGERLTFKAGFDLSRLRDRSLTEDDFNGTFEFASLEDYIARTPTTYMVATGDPLLELTQVEAAAFVQNDLRVSNRLMLMFGVRYEAQSNLDDWNNFDPRLGYAYAVNDSTVLRGGVGLFHSRLGSNNVERLLRLDGTRQQELVVTNPSYPNPFLSGTTELIPPSSIRVRAPGLEAASELRAQVSIEQTLPGNARATVSYDYSRSRNEYRSVNLNTPRPAAPGRTPATGPQRVAGSRPDPTQGNILELQSTGKSAGHRLRFDVQQRLRILTLSGNYSLNREMSDTEGPFGLPSNNYDLSADWGRGRARVHQLSGSVNAQLPLGLFLTLGVRARSGEPYTITTGRDDNGDTESNDRPPGVPRNSGTDPRFLSTDMNLSKVFFLRRDTDAGPRTGGAGTQINVFTNISNVLNRANLKDVSGALTSTRFGEPTSADAPREIEIGMRFQF
jgi:hypothetical protein